MDHQPYPLHVAEVSIEDDGIRRFVVWHFRYDPERRERRNIPVAVFDNEREFIKRCDELSAELKRLRESSEDFDSWESISGVVLEPGHLERAKNSHLMKRAMAHGTVPPDVKARLLKRLRGGNQ